MLIPASIQHSNSDPGVMTQLLDIADFRTMPSLKLPLTDKLIANQQANVPSMLVSTLLLFAINAPHHHHMHMVSSQSDMSTASVSTTSRQQIQYNGEFILFMDAKHIKACIGVIT